jgi:hypothetical protein
MNRKRQKSKSNWYSENNSHETHPKSNTSEATHIKVSELLDQVTKLSKPEILKICGDAKRRFIEHPEQILLDIENIRRFQNETGERVINLDLNTVEGFNQAVAMFKMILRCV